MKLSKKLAYVLSFVFLTPGFLWAQTEVTDTVKASTLLPSQDAEIAYNRGVGELSQGQTEAAIASFSAAIELKPDFEKAWLNRGIARLQQNKYKEAQEDFLKTEILNDKTENLYFNLAQCYRFMDQSEKAKAAYSRSIDQKENLASSCYYRGMYLFIQKDYQGAIADFDAAIKENPDYAYAYHDRAGAKKQTGDFNGALEDYQKVVQLKPDADFAYNNLGSIKKKMGDINGAILDYSKAISLKKDFYIAYNNRGSAKFEQGDYKGAIEDFTEAIKIKSDYSFAFNNRGSAKFKMKDYEGAFDDCNQAIKLNSSYGSAFLNRGNSREMLRDEKGACSDWKKAADLGIAEAKKLVNDCR